MNEQKISVTNSNSDGNKIGNYIDLRTVFLQYCEGKKLNIKDAAELLDRLKDDLQKQECHVIPRDLFGGN